MSIPQTHLAGAEAEVDFGEFYATIAGLVVKCWMFVMRLSHSGKAFHVAFATQAQEAFLEGHVLAFAYFGGVPGRIRYDNLKPAVIRVLKGRDRTESERFTALRSHYGFDSFFCRPGIDGAHEKGGVEGEIGRFRRRHLVPVPTVASLAELNELIAVADGVDDDRVITGRPITIGAAFTSDFAARRNESVRAYDRSSKLLGESIARQVDEMSTTVPEPEKPTESGPNSQPLRDPPQPESWSTRISSQAAPPSVVKPLKQALGAISAKSGKLRPRNG